MFRGSPMQYSRADRRSGTGVSSSTKRHLFQHKHELQGHGYVVWISAARCRVEFSRDVLPRVLGARRRRQIAEQPSDVCQRLECHHLGNAQRPRQGPRPIGAFRHWEFDAGNGRNPTCEPTHPGCCSVAPFDPHAVQRAQRRSLSLDSSGPHRMISGVIAIGAWCWQRSHHSQSQQWLLCSWASVGRGPGACRFAGVRSPRCISHRAIARGLKLEGSPLIRPKWRLKNAIASRYG
jgi:hypothetical protein